MATPGIPNGFVVQTANQQNLVSWNQVAGATSYIVQRSLDNVTYAPVAIVSGTPLATSYLDIAVTIGTEYWYNVSSASSSTTGSITSSSPTVTSIPSTVGYLVGQSIGGLGIPEGTTIAVVNSPTQITLSQNAVLTNPTATLYINISSYTQPQSAIPAPTGEMSLAALRLAVQQYADRVNSNFVTEQELNSFINRAMFELYDILITVYEDLYVAPAIQFTTDGVTYQYTLPNGSNQFMDANNLTGPLITPPPFYKLLGVDLQVQNTNNGYVTINKFMFISRNKFVYPNTSSTIYGVFNMMYRLMGKNLQFIPTPSANQGIRLWYIPRLKELLQDTDITDTGISGWLEYVIVRASKYILDKEETDTSRLTEELLYLKGRIEETAAGRDVGNPDVISDTRANAGYWNNGNGGWNGSSGGY